MKRRIRLTEADLHKIVRRSVKRALKEGAMGTAYENLEQAQRLLSDITNSSFIPFSSPSPSSTEEELKNTIIEAARLVDKAMYLCGKLGYNGPVANVV